MTAPLPAPRSVVACVTERGGDDHLVAAAIEAARAQDARLIFYVHDAVRRFGSVRPTFWSADCATAFPSLMTAVQLEMSGEHQSALTVARARAEGLDAYGLIPEQRGPRGVASAASREHASVVLMGPRCGLEDAVRKWAGAADGRPAVTVVR